MILVADDTAKALVSRLAPMRHADFSDNDRGLRVKDGRRTVMAFVFSDYRPHFGTVEMSAVGLHSWALGTDIVAALADYAYRQLRCNRVWARTSSTNDRAKGLLKQFGFVREATHADYYGVGLHAETYRMLAREWLAFSTRMKEAA